MNRTDQETGALRAFDAAMGDSRGIEISHLNRGAAAYENGGTDNTRKVLFNGAIETVEQEEQLEAILQALGIRSENLRGVVGLYNHFTVTEQPAGDRVIYTFALSASRRQLP